MYSIDTGSLDYLDKAATYHDDERMTVMFLDNVVEHFDYIPPTEEPLFYAMEKVFQHYIEFNEVPEWFKELASKTAKERFAE
jgi:hypothetical protein